MLAGEGFDERVGLDRYTQYALRGRRIASVEHGRATGSPTWAGHLRGRHGAPRTFGVSCKRFSTTQLVSPTNCRLVSAERGSGSDRTFEPVGLLPEILYPKTALPP